MVGETFNALKEFDAFLQNVCFEIPAVGLAGMNGRISYPFVVFLGALWKLSKRNSLLRGLGMGGSGEGKRKAEGRRREAEGLTQNEDWLFGPSSFWGYLKGHLF